MNDRERLIELIGNAPYGKRKMIDCFFEDTIETIADYLIENDVIIQKHGRWIYEDETLNTSSGYRCSACRRSLRLSPDVPQAFMYCPNCGAKMVGDSYV